MKKIAILSFIIGSTYIGHTQCGFTPACNNPITGAYLSNQNYNGDQCFQGPMVISTSVNWNNIYNWVFNSVQNQQTINVPYGGNVYSNGYTTLNQVNFTGNGHLWVQGGETHVFSGTSNNSNPSAYNTVTISNGGLFFYNGIQYQAGDTIQFPGNASNRVYVLGCDNTPLGLTSILYFEVGRNYMKWEVDSTNFKQVEIMCSHSDLSVEYDDMIWTKVDSSFKIKDIYQVTTKGTYRIKVGNDYSFMTDFDMNTNLPPNSTSTEPKRIILYKTPNGYNATKILR